MVHNGLLNMKIARIIVLLGAMCLLAACVSTTSHPALEVVQQTELAKSLRRQYTNTMMFVEWSDKDGTRVYLGLDHGNYTTRKAAIVVRPNGTIWRQVKTPDNRLDWEPVK